MVFIFSTGDDYIRRAFFRRGWVENQIIESSLFDIRWDLNENNIDFEKLSNGQLCNHFPNNQELTTKTGLARNLLRLTDFGMDQESFFPRCYDFTDEKQITTFTDDFERTAIFNFVKKHSILFKRYHKQYFNVFILYRELKNVASEMERLKKWNNKQPWIKRAKNYYKGVYWPTPENSTVTNISYLNAALTYVKYQIKKRNQILNGNKTEKWFIWRNKIKNLWENLVLISTFRLPFTASTIKSFPVICFIYNYRIQQYLMDGQCQMLI